MSGSVFLGGGGSANDERSLWQRMLRGRERVVYWPFAQPQGRVERARVWLTSALGEIDPSIEVETWRDLESRHPRQLIGADLLFVGGGNTYRLLGHIQEHGFLEHVRDFVLNGGAYYGGSAGAILAADDIRLAELLDTNDVGLTDFTGLGLTDGYAILPHFNSNRSASRRSWMRQEGQRRLYGVPERSGLAFSDNTWEAFGAESVWELSADQETPHRPGDRWT